MADEPKKNMAVEGLRGLMILMIVVFHLYYRFNELYLTAPATDYLGISSWGDIGRCMFIVLSAFFLFNTKPDDSFSLWGYYKAKLKRLWPVYFVSITMTFAVTNIVNLPYRTYGWLEYLLNACFVNGFIGVPYIDGAHWYLTTLLALILVYGLIQKIHFKYAVLIYGGWILAAVIVKACSIFARCPCLVSSSRPWAVNTSAWPAVASC